MWIVVNTLSILKFSITKKNPIMVYPAVAKQYTNGAWVQCDLAVFYDAAWHSELVTMFPNGSVEWESAVYSTDSNKGAVTIGTGVIVMANAWTGTQNFQMAYTTTGIDVTPFSQLGITLGSESSADLIKTFGLTTAPSGSHDVDFEVRKSTTDRVGTIVMDISAISGVRYIKLRQFADNANANRYTYITDIFLQ